MNKKEHITHLQKQAEAKSQPLRKTSALYSTLRLSSIVLAIALAIYADQTKTSFGFVLAILCIVFFLVLVKKHQKVKTTLRMYEAKIAVLDKLLRRMSDDWKKEEFKVEEEVIDTVAIDLDLLGKQSLYQYLCMAGTPFGKQQLQEWLLGHEDQAEAITMRQHAVKALLEKEDAVLSLQTSSHLFIQDQRKIKKEDFTFLLEYGKKDKEVLPNIMYGISSCMVLYTFVTLLLAIFKMLPYGFFAVGVLLNLCVCFAAFVKAGSELSFTKNLGQIMMDYQRMFEVIVENEYHDPYILAQQAFIKSGLKGIRKLGKIMSYLSLRHNFISYILLSALCQLDIFCLYALTSWRKKYGVNLEEWLIAAGNMEALTSLCVISQVKTICSFPIIVPNASMHLELTNAYHPLIAESKAVVNSFEGKNGSILVTGSNMSGKTTFLRTLGINVMLYRAGAQVCASSMSATILKVHTSMRLRDDVNEGISTFYAELLRIRQMMDAADKKTPMLVLIDEIFKGTNSADRILCAKTAITKLHRPWIMTLVSTHDFELCDLDKDPEVQAINYHFSEYYVNDEIHFDYTLKEGRCTTTNAQQLMRLAGF